MPTTTPERRRFDLETLKAVAWALIAIAAVSALFIVVGRIIGFEQDGMLAQFFGQLRESWLALPAVVLVFVLAALVGAPQFLLIAVTVAAFGPLAGFLYSYIATLVSASINFEAARRLGTRWLERRALRRLEGLRERIGDQGFYAAMLVRIVPSAPFVVVNAALGLSRTPYLAFIAGTAVGIIPKTALIALLGKVVEQAIAGEARAIVTLVGAAALWLALVVGARALVRAQLGRRRGTGTGGT
ncbi:MAG: TVP38/TMEM64 family protein [Rhizobiales bacterium]|nr:TVP38/TMEM64 family protein [Hyphomicrobiales bacterium]